MMYLLTACSIYFISSLYLFVYSYIMKINVENGPHNLNFFFFFFCLIKKVVTGVDLSTPRHVIAISNTTYITRALLELSFKPLISRCRNKNSYHQATPHVVHNSNFQHLVLIKNIYCRQCIHYNCDFDTSRTLSCSM